MDTIASLNPKPGGGLENIAKDNVIPDITVQDNNGKFTISINDSMFPELIISKDYKNMFSDKKHTSEINTFIKKKIESANWFIDAINQRKKTMLLVMESIIKHQPDFFRYDNRQLKPMILKDVAEDINMDISTISRVTNGKFVQLPYGIFELKYFFSEGIKMKSGKIVSNTIIKEKIKYIIISEDKKNPLGDDKIMRLLHKEGYEIARRTVTKYREKMKIPVGRLRKEI